MNIVNRISVFLSYLLLSQDVDLCCQVLTGYKTMLTKEEKIRISAAVDKNPGASASMCLLTTADTEDEWEESLWQ